MYLLGTPLPLKPSMGCIWYQENCVRTYMTQIAYKSFGNLRTSCIELRIPRKRGYAEENLWFWRILRVGVVRRRRLVGIITRLAYGEAGPNKLIVTYIRNAANWKRGEERRGATTQKTFQSGASIIKSAMHRGTVSFTCHIRRVIFTIRTQAGQWFIIAGLINIGRFCGSPSYVFYN